jgi:hypothetical protein
MAIIDTTKVAHMRIALLALVIWLSPSLLFIAWRLWMSRPLRVVNYRDQWPYSHALTHELRYQPVVVRDR